MEITATEMEGLSPYAEWALETGIWDGSAVSWQNASPLRNELAQRIVQFLFSQDPDSLTFQQMSATFAAIGSIPEERLILASDIRELGLSPQGILIPAGFFKSIAKFWKKHKVEILIGVAVIAAVTAVAVVAICASTAAVIGATESTPNKTPQSPPPPVTLPEISIPLAEPGLPLSLLPTDRGVLLDGQYRSFQDILQYDQWNHSLKSIYDSPRIGFTEPFVIDQPWICKTIPSKEAPLYTKQEGTYMPPPQLDLVPEQSFLRWAMETIGANIGDETPEFTPQEPHRVPSQSFFTEGYLSPKFRIDVANGMRNSLPEALENAQYIASMAPGMSIGWTYNHSNGLLVDLCEALTVNQLGISFPVDAIDREKWIQFHEANLDHPEAKFFQACHSQGTLVVDNALDSVPPEVQQRVMVFAFAPATIISKDKCYQVMHYACKTDPIPSWALRKALKAVLYNNDSTQGEQILNILNTITFLDPHPDTVNVGHSLQDPVFREILEKSIQSYLKKYGEN